MFLDGSVAPVPSTDARGAPNSRARRSPARQLLTPPERELTRALGCTAQKGGWAKCATLGATGFPLADFKHSLTLFSKFFASFPHGTCSLSVSRQYLALDGIYHPIQAAIPSNPTLQGRIVRPRTATAQDSHLLRYPVPRDLSGGHGRWRISRLQFRRHRASGLAA